MTLSTITYGAYTIDPAALSEKTLQALLSRAVAHVLGNEAASTVTGKIKAELGESATRDDVKAYRETHTAQVDAWTREAQDAKHTAILGGTLGDRVGTPRGTALDTVIRAVAWEEVSAIMTKNGLKFPKAVKGSDESPKIVTPDGSFTKAELIARRVAKHTDRITKEAKRRMTIGEKAEGDEI